MLRMMVENSLIIYQKDILLKIIRLHMNKDGVESFGSDCAKTILRNGGKMKRSQWR